MDSTTTSLIPPSIKASSHSTVLQAISQTTTTNNNNNKSTSDESSKESQEVDPTKDTVTTVFSDAANFNVKHPLYSTWQMWFDSASKQDKSKSWSDALVKVIAFSSVEEFWGLYNNIVPPSLIHPNSNYYLFKEGIKPAWEDSANSKGGKWSVQLPRGKYSEQIDGFWLNTMLAAIGETFETPYDPTNSSSTPIPSSFLDEVTGVIVSARKAFFRINIWTRNSATPDKARIEEIGRQFKFGILNFEQGGAKFSASDKVSSDVEFMSHQASQEKYGVKVEKWVV